MSTTTPQEDFLRDASKHVMETIRNDDVYRHIRFRQPGTLRMHFDLITWPGYLCYTGDMGTYVFTRLHDMFEFFRADRRGEDGLYINRSYWSEKLVAVDGSRRAGAAKEFKEEKFRRVINEYRVAWMRDRRLDKAQRRELWESVDWEVLRYLNDSDSDAAQRAAYDFSWSFTHPSMHRRTQTFRFTDLFEHDFTDYTYRFTWCCYALAWGIRTYDAARAMIEPLKGGAE